MVIGAELIGRITVRSLQLQSSQIQRVVKEKKKIFLFLFGQVVKD
jgi:hypothetical protein